MEKSIQKRIFLSSPTMHGEEQIYIREAFETNWIAPLGANVDGLEKEISNYIGVRTAVALSSGTSAIHLAVKLADVTQGDIVFCSDLTFSATVNPVSYEKGVPVFIDSEYDTWNMDPVALEKAFKKYNGVDNPKPKAVIVVNLYGTPAKLDLIKKICDKHEVVLIEDAAESLAAIYNGQQTGTFGKYSILSFNGNKIITTSGGGMLLSNDVKAIEKARFWATQSRDVAPHYQHSEIGYNYRMSNVLAAIGRGQLKYLEEHRRLKRDIYNYYKERFNKLPLSMNPYTENSEPNFWLSCLLLDQKSTIVPYDIMWRLAESNIEARPVWKPMHMQPIFEKCDFIIVKNSAVSEDIFARGLCLPSDIKMRRFEQQMIIDIINNMF